MAIHEQPYPRQYLYRRIVQSKLFIDSNYAETLDVERISDRAALSKFHFIRVFKSIYGRTPYQYLVHVRIERAKQLLKGDISVTEACFAVGFDSVSSFAGLFKRLVGETPLAYQMRQRSLSAEVSMIPLKFIPGCFAEKVVRPNNSNFREAEY